MLDLNQFKVAERYQQELREEAKRWNMARQNDEYKPNKSIRNFRRKQNR